MVVSSASVWVRRGSSLPETQEPSPLAKLSLKQVVDARWDKDSSVRDLMFQVRQSKPRPGIFGGISASPFFFHHST